MCIWTLTVRYSLRNVIHYSLRRQVKVAELYHNGISFVKNSGQKQGNLGFLVLYFQESLVSLFGKLNDIAGMV